LRRTVWPEQSALLKELGLDAIYVNPLEKEPLAKLETPDVKTRLVESVWKMADEAVKAWRRIAMLAYDVFQV